MKVSNYNFFKNIDSINEKWMAYNSFTNSLAVIEDENYREFRKFEEDNRYKLSDELFKKLCTSGFIVADNKNERELLEYEKQEERFDQTNMYLTIAPTLACNFRCVYCYEKERYENLNMSEQVEKSIVQYVEAKADILNSLSVSWYGGEPLLVMNILSRLSKKFIDLCEKYNIYYNAMVVTNGYLLSEKNAAELSRAGIKSVQITLDGMEERHNQKRPLKNGGKTYDTIIENIKKCSKYFDEINIRVNCDKDNINDYSNLYNKIKSFGLSNIKMYAVPIRDFEGCYSCGSCLNRCEFKDLECDIYKNLGGEIYERFIMDKYPTRGNNYCGAQRNNSIIVAADGEMYKCWTDVGDIRRSFGNICNIKEIDISNYIYYNYATKGKECEECKIFPICSGGCPRENKIGKSDVCEYTEDLLYNYLEEIVEYKLKINRQQESV